jgi:hypothetical protein
MEGIGDHVTNAYWTIGLKSEVGGEQVSFHRYGNRTSSSCATEGYATPSVLKANFAISVELTPDSCLEVDA